MCIHCNAVVPNSLDLIDLCLHRSDKVEQRYAIVDCIRCYVRTYDAKCHLKQAADLEATISADEYLDSEYL